MAGKKGRSGRKKRRVLVEVDLWLDPVRDADLVAFFADLPPGTRPAAVKAALRGGIDQGRQAAAGGETAAVAGLLDGIITAEW